jgi:hypothetical protein
MKINDQPQRKFEGIPITMIIPFRNEPVLSPLNNTTNAVNDDDPSLSAQEKLTRRILDMEITFLRKLIQTRCFNDFDSLYPSIIEKNPGNLALLALNLEAAVKQQLSAETRIERVNDLIGKIDTSSLRTSPLDSTNDEQAQKKRKENEEYLITALHQKAIALFELSDDLQNQKEKTELEGVISQLETLSSLKKPTFVQFYIRYLSKQGLLGQAFELCLKTLQEKPLGADQQEVFNL